ncbi:MAG TPA: hypothetical protein VGG99_01880 [Acetobacteraceae bacterium]|jgi:hypothetical protein
MTDGAALFSARYPVVWHVIEAEGAGPWLAETGLLPTAALLGLAGGADHGANRAEFRRVEFAPGRVAVIRPQLMQDHRLLPTLAGRFARRPEAWRRHINAHVFCWTEPRRRDAFVRACLRWDGGRATPVVLEIDTAALLRIHGDRAFWSRINAGSTVRGGGRVRRDEATLAPVSQYRSGPVAELAVRGPMALGVPRERTPPCDDV